MLKVARGIARRIRGVQTAIAVASSGTRCPACAEKSVLIKKEAMWQKLADEWGISPEWVKRFSIREGHRCSHCGTNERGRWLAGY